MIIGTAGHIDHGKTALVRALTGIDADRLPEERRRGMTIDLGFAYRALLATAGRPPAVLGFVDVPGHERFIHNMLAGTTGIEFVLLVVAADDGPMPQTREHLDIVSLLGVEHGVVALTKTDLVSRQRRAEAVAEVRDLVRGSALENAAILPVSSVTGEGIGDLESHLTSVAVALGAREPQGEFRMAIDRSFVLPGVGVVATGTVAAGCIRVGGRAMLTPSGIEARVRSIHANNRPAPLGQAGERCALNLTGARVERERVRRGDWVVASALHMPRTRLDTRLQLLFDGMQPLKSGVTVHLHLGAARVEARLMPLGAGALLPGAQGPARLVLDHPIGAWRSDRFILRDAAASRTLGGGVVLDPDPPVRGRRGEGRLAALAALTDPRPAAAFAGLLEVSAAGVDLDRFACDGGMTPAELRTACGAAAARVVRAEGSLHGIALSPSHFGALQQQIVTALGAHHRTVPESPGLAPDQLEAALSPRLPPAPFRAVLGALVEAGTVAASGAAIHLPDHRTALPPGEVRLWAQIRRRLEINNFAGMWARDLAREMSVPEGEMRRLMKRLAQMGEVVEVAPDRFYRRQTVHEMAELVAQLCTAAGDGTMTAAAFRDRIGTGRKLAIIILEFFDRTGVTIRRGDLRKMDPNRRNTFLGASLRSRERRADAR